MEIPGKRHFLRYEKNADFVLKADNKSYSCHLLDYCLDGIGAIVRGNPSLRKGDIVKVALEKPLMNFSGEIVWTEDVPGGLRVGLRNVGRLAGVIRDYRVADILIGLQRTPLTGTLIFKSGSIIKKVYVKNGDMIFAASNQKEDGLADVLLREGIITLDQYDHSVAEVNKSSQEQGAVLVRLGYLRPEELVTAVKYYVEEIIRSLFLLKTGSFYFEASPLPRQEIITLKLSAATLIYFGVKRAVAWGQFKDELPSVECVPFFSDNPLDLFQDIKLDITGKRTASLVDGKTSIKDIVHIAGLDEFEILKSIYALMSARVIETANEGRKGTEIPREIIDDVFEKGADAEMDSELREMIEQMHGNCERLGYYGILGVKDQASLSEIKSAYYRAAKRFHPDMHFRQADESMKGKLSSIFSYVHEAYSILSSPHKRAEYDRLLKTRPAKLTTARDRARASFEEGKSHLRSHDYRNAELLFGQATYFDGAISEYHYYYGLSLLKQHQMEKAAKAIEAALRLDPLNAMYLSELGFVYLDLGFPQRASGLFSKALRRSPDHQRSLEGLRKIDQLQADRP